MYWGCFYEFIGVIINSLILLKFVMKYEELSDWLRLVYTDGIGAESVCRLLAAFGLPAQIFAQPATALRQVLQPDQVEKLQQLPEDHAALLEATWQWLQGATDHVQRRIFTLACSDYPACLLQVDQPPPLLYGMGQLQRLGQSPALAMVGSRNPTPQGKEHAYQFAKTLAQQGWTVVSGLALGIDEAAHEGALAGCAEGGLATVAVVGTGIDRVYPRQHWELAQRIVQHGVILSECPVGMPPRPHHFPRRNRLIAGLSAGVLVVEAAPQSGSLITARQAGEQGKEVFAIPGSIHAQQSRGCHALIRQGAKLVESVEDIFQELGSIYQPSWELPTSAGTEPLLEKVGFEPVSLDVLQVRTGLETAALQAQLLTWELEGSVAKLPGGLFQRLRGRVT